MALNLKQIHQQISNLMPAVNRLLVKKFSLPKKVSYKTTGGHLGTSVVTETDKQVEEILKQKLKAILPGSGFIGEETSAEIKDYNWIVDPIDGTLNFASQVPVFACSIALWQENQPVYAYVSLPLATETIHGFAGQGIYLNSQPVKPMPKTTEKLFLTLANAGIVDDLRKGFTAISQFTSSPRLFGSCVFQGAQIALGRLDGGLFLNQALWDIAAIVLLAREAGLTVKYISHQPNVSADDLKNYQYSLAIGPEKLAGDLCRSISK